MTAPLATIGYEGRTLEDYLERLHAARVTLLCDVRNNPWSRKRGFAKKALSIACDEAGIHYEHMPELGIEAAKRRNVETEAARDALFADYASTTLVDESAAIDTIVAWLNAGETVALTCYELDPRDCHRSHLAAAIVARVPGSVISHL